MLDWRRLLRGCINCIRGGVDIVYCICSCTEERKKNCNTGRASSGDQNGEDDKNMDLFKKNYFFSPHNHKSANTRRTQVRLELCCPHFHPIVDQF